LKVAISSGRQAHYRLPANSFVRRGFGVELYTATPRSRMRGFDAEVRNRWIPAPVTLAGALLHTRTPKRLDELDSTLFDRLAALALEDCDLLLGAASSSLVTGLAVQQRGGIFVLDRACPDIRVQQALLAEEARKAGGTFRANSGWFIERQVEEYERADYILSPSETSRGSFPEDLQEKIVLAPLFGRVKGVPQAAKAPGGPFVLGVVGGHPLRKGYLYLLQAWKELALPDAELRLRADSEIFQFPVLAKLLEEQPSVQVVGYVDDIAGFYAACDAFILPSVDDGFGMALFEALANGVASIATRNCGASELLVGERDALLIDAFSVEQIKQAVLRLYESTELRERLAVAGPAAVEALQEGDLALPYEAGIDRLLVAIAGAR
jgi:glycosyltransferase involved in cell wall biosynthesis